MFELFTTPKKTIFSPNTTGTPIVTEKNNKPVSIHDEIDFMPKSDHVMLFSPLGHRSGLGGIDVNSPSLSTVSDESLSSGSIESYETMSEGSPAGEGSWSHTDEDENTVKLKPTEITIRCEDDTLRTTDSGTVLSRFTPLTRFTVFALGVLSTPFLELAQVHLTKYFLHIHETLLPNIYLSSTCYAVVTNVLIAFFVLAVVDGIGPWQVIFDLIGYILYGVGQIIGKSSQIIVKGFYDGYGS